VAAASIGLWLTLAMPVFAQESYYWSYSQHPALSYFDHPPMVAWLIWVGAQLFGDGAAGIRLGTWLCGCVLILAGLALLREFGATARSREIWLVLAGSTPVLIMTRFLANPDPPLACAWTLTLLFLWRARSGSLVAWSLAGVAAGVALLSKYTAVFLAAGGLLVLAFDPAMRGQLRRLGPYLGVLVAAVTFAPVVVWNVAHDFESFRFQTAGRWQHAQLGWHWLAQFVAGQLLVLNPVVAVLLPVVLLWLWQRRRVDVRATWLMAFGVPLPAFLLFSSAFVQVKINWLAPAVVPLVLGTAWWWGEAFVTRRAVAARRWLGAALIVGIAAVLAPVVRMLPQHRGTSWAGWDEIAACAEKWESTIDDPDGIEGNVFFFAGDYRDAAQLGRSLKMHVARVEPAETVEPTLAQNVFGRPALQFDHWESPASRIGQDAIFVLTRPDDRGSLVQAVAECFDSMTPVERVHVRRCGIELASADVFVCRRYRGPNGHG